MITGIILVIWAKGKHNNKERNNYKRTKDGERRGREREKEKEREEGTERSFD